MKKALMLLCLSLASFSYVAAQHVAQGTVVDADGNPIPGVKVEIKGSTVSTLTELDGTFELQSETPFKKVRLMYSGMQPKVAKVKPDRVIKLHTTSWWTRKPNKYSWIISPQVVFPESKVSHPSFGLMVARVKEFGFYGKIVYSPSENCIEKGDYRPLWFTGKDKRSYSAVTAGLIYRLKCPIHLYAGGGYVDRQVCGQLLNGTYYRDDYLNSYKGLVFELGLLLRYGSFSLSGGLIDRPYHFSGRLAANFGIGFSF